MEYLEEYYSPYKELVNTGHQDLCMLSKALVVTPLSELVDLRFL